jgi:hypothetical protein
MKKLALPLLVFVMLMMAVLPASAGLTWCATDPEVVLPNGQGSVYVMVEVPQAYQGEAVTLNLGVPKGAQVVPQPGEVNVKIVTHEIGNAKHIIATVHADFPIRLSATQDGQQLGQFVFLKGDGTANWKW